MPKLFNNAVLKLPLFLCQQSGTAVHDSGISQVTCRESSSAGVAVELTTGLPFHYNDNLLGSRQLRGIEPGSSRLGVRSSITTPSTHGLEVFLKYDVSINIIQTLAPFRYQTRDGLDLL